MIGVAGRRFAAALRLFGDHHDFDPVHVGDPRLRLAVAVGDEQRRHRFDLAFAFDPGLEHLVRRQLVDAGELQRAAVAFLDHLRGDPADLAFDECCAAAARAAVADLVADDAGDRPAARPRPQPGAAQRAEPAAAPAASRRRAALRLAGVGPHLGHQRARAAAARRLLALDRLRQRLHRRLQPAHLLAAALAAFEVALELGRLLGSSAPSM